MKNSIVIIDPMLSPYFMKMDGAGYNIYKRFVPKKSKDGKTPEPYEKYISRSTDIVSACKSVLVKKMMESKKDSNISLREFIKIYEELNKNVFTFVRNDLDENLKSINNSIERITKENEELKSLVETLSQRLDKLENKDSEYTF